MNYPNGMALECRSCDVDPPMKHGRIWLQRETSKNDMAALFRLLSSSLPHHALMLRCDGGGNTCSYEARF